MIKVNENNLIVKNKEISLKFKDKEVDSSNNSVKLFLKELEGSNIYLVHSFRDSGFVSYWLIEGENGSSTREANSKKSLATTNATLENKLIKLAGNFASKDEVSSFLEEAGLWIKNHQDSLFHFSDILERSKKERALLSVYKYINGRFNVIIDNDTLDICIYQPKEGFYREYDFRTFSKFLKTNTKRDFFEDEVKKIMGLPYDILEESKDYIAFKNCLMNISSLEPRVFSPEIFTKFKVPYDWNPDAHSEFFIEKLKEILGSEYQRFLEVVGYLFVKGNPHNKLALLIGDGANGKSLLMELIAAIFTNSYAAVPLQEFSKEFGMQPLVGKRVNILSDLPLDSIDETGQIKAITGEDSVTINRKFKEQITTKLECKIIGSGNRLPKVKDDSYAFWRRILIIRLYKTFEGESKDSKLKEKLLNDHEGLEWFIYQSIQAYKKIQDIGWPEDKTYETRQQFLEMSNPALYCAEKIFTYTSSADTFVSRDEVLEEIKESINHYGLEEPGNESDYYDAVRIMGAKEAQKRINKEKVHGFRYIQMKT
jgi:putative DNA primase/helicase